MTGNRFWIACGVFALAYPAYVVFKLLAEGAGDSSTNGIANILLWSGCSAALGIKAIVEGLR